MNANQGHTTWCAGGHQCRLGEHRAQPISFQIPGAGSVVLTRIRSANGVDPAEVRLSVTLPAGEADARARLTALLSHLRVLIGPPRPTRKPGSAAARPAIGHSR